MITVSGQKVSATENAVRAWEYNTGGYLTAAVADPDDLALRTEYLAYNSAGDPAQVKDPRGHVSGIVYDARRRAVAVTAPPPSVGAFRPKTEVDYDKNGRVTQIRRATGEAAPDDWLRTRFAYLANGRIATVTDPEGNVTAYSYNEMNLADVVADAEGRRVKTSSACICSGSGRW